MGAAIVRTARIRSEGNAEPRQGQQLRRVRTGWWRKASRGDAPGAEPHAETDPLDTGAEGENGINMQGVIALEDLTLKSPPLEGVVLRYG